METRTITEVKTFKLILNPIHERCEHGQIVVISTDRDKIIEFYNNELVPGGYTDEGINAWDNSVKIWHKQFRRNGPLEWFNPVSDILNGLDMHHHGISYEWIEEDTYHNTTIVKV